MDTGRHTAAQTDFISDISTAGGARRTVGRGSMPRPVPSCPCWAFEDGAWLGPVPPAPPQTLGVESPRLALLPAPHVISPV